MPKLETEINGVTLDVYYSYNKASEGGNDTPSYPEHTEIVEIAISGSEIDIQAVLSDEVIQTIEKELEV